MNCDGLVCGILFGGGLRTDVFPPKWSCKVTAISVLLKGGGVLSHLGFVNSVHFLQGRFWRYLIGTFFRGFGPGFVNAPSIFKNFSGRVPQIDLKIVPSYGRRN